jgi:hypothetical protein
MLQGVLIPIAHLRGIESGVVTVAFRRWTAPRVRVGTRLRTKVGLVEITSLDVIDPAELTEADAAAAGETLPALNKHLDRHPDRPLFRIGVRHAGPDPRVALRRSKAGVADVAARLVRLDRASNHGPWTQATLEAIKANPGLRAEDLAATLGREKLPFKRDVRKLKELGLTESLEVGYRLSPRGWALLRTRG